MAAKRDRKPYRKRAKDEPGWAEYRESRAKRLEEAATEHLRDPAHIFDLLTRSRSSETRRQLQAQLVILGWFVMPVRDD